MRRPSVCTVTTYSTKTASAKPSDTTRYARTVGIANSATSQKKNRLLRRRTELLNRLMALDYFGDEDEEWSDEEGG